MDQLSLARGPIESSFSAAPKTGEAPPQLTRARQGASTPEQLSKRERSAASGPQLAAGKRSASAPEPLSSAKDGRTAAVERVEGKDRCDPATAKGRPLPRACAAVIERRAAQFGRAATPVLSPEQRILIGDRALQQAGIDGAARRLAISGEDAKSEEAQGLASVVLTAPPEPRKPEEKDPALGEAEAAIVNAVLNPK